MTTLFFVWCVLAVLAVIALTFFVRRHKRRCSRGPLSASESNGESGLRDSLVHVLSFPWIDILPHVKLNEFLQLTGETVAGERFLAIFQIENSRAMELICLRIGGDSLKLNAGEKGLASLKQNCSLMIWRKHSGEIRCQTVDEADDTPGGTLPEHPFSCVISIVNSLKTGTTIYLAAKCSRLESAFIKSWDIPARYADEALLATMSVSADVAHLAERIKDVQPSRLHNVPGQRIEPLRPGVCYVLGGWGGNEISFASGSDIALLIVDSFDPTTSLATFLETLSLEPLMHARLVHREVAAGRFEAMLVYPDPESESHRVHNLKESNAVLAMRSKEGALRDVLKVIEPDGGGAAFQLTYLPTSEFQNVLLWCLGSKEREARKEIKAESLQIAA